MKLYCSNPFVYQRRKTRVVTVGKVAIGGDNPVRVQSMLTCDTMDTATCVKQTLELVATGCEIVRITAPTVKDAANLENIKSELLAAGCDVPIVADIHFKPEAALEAAKWVEKVRINPGNFADKKKFQVREYNDAEYAEELGRIEESFLPLLEICKERKLAIRIGTNHGSLSDRIMNRYGDTPLGMVESALEFARIARKYDFHNFLFSMKSSNPKVMVNAYRLLSVKLQEEGEDWNYPLHLGVTEAGEGEDGRIKSAIGIGSLLKDGLGDTIRVSLTEDSIHEVPVAKALVSYVQSLNKQELPKDNYALSFDPYVYAKRNSVAVSVNGINVGGENPARVFATQENYTLLEPRFKALGDTAPEIVYEKSAVVEIDLNDEEQINKVNHLDNPVVVTIKDGTKLNPIVAYRILASKVHPRHPVLLKDTFLPDEPVDQLQALLSSAVHIGAMLCDGIGDAILIRQEKAPGASIRLGFNILQAAGNRIFKTDYVACPSCGRTLFNLQTTTARIKAATLHLKGVKIAVMGCIVNGPGEMADADFGYVGGAPGKINLYVGKKPVKFNIPEDEAVERLVDLIREHGKWVDAPAPVEAK
ncbi:MAG: (E)-4-hydroxy-3-methylbut-2-enyl-diphosphate synthase [Verrucomicrobiales bacterium]|jgi:(E)-4-hydroxy-3-methylbut-2-enyl-diphosphate synthase|nr:(E)-4-hydroxy-3-methylbut-2-enyl-diphosphate synthase [Verrucomicrobiales bacterium]